MIKNYQDRNGFVNVSGIEIFKKDYGVRKRVTGNQWPLFFGIVYLWSSLTPCFFFLPRKTCLSQDRLRAITSV